MTLGNRPAIHPGEILLDLYLKPIGLSSGALAKRLGVPRTRIERLVTQQTSLTPDTALRLSKFFNTTAEFWMNMQTSYDLKIYAEHLRDEIDAIHQMEAA